jgi:hypothetical protein
MIISIGTEVYVALAKGPLTTSGNSGLPFGGHLIIINIAHTPTTNASETAEVDDYGARLSKFFAERDCDTVMWEVRQNDAIHAYRQVVAVPRSRLLELHTSLEERFIEGFASKDYNLEEREPGESEEYCRVILPKGSYVASIPARFDLQLPRRILARLMGLEEREEWRNCIQTPEEEAEDGLAWRSAFQPPEVTPLNDPQ